MARGRGSWLALVAWPGRARALGLAGGAGRLTEVTGDCQAEGAKALRATTESNKVWAEQRPTCWVKSYEEGEEEGEEREKKRKRKREVEGRREKKETQA
ncbi:hypothetical protein NL676_007028 [Syzygium grande]|nr:hypothetical protein NL676_007028 [Syzygium grande]